MSEVVVTYQPPNWALLMCTLLGLSSAATNLVSFVRALKMRGSLDRSLMFLICIDPLTSVFCGIVFTTMATLRYFQISNVLMCDIFFLSIHTPLFVGVVSTALVAVIRFISIKRSATKKVSDALLFKLNILAFVIIFTSIGINFLVHKLTDHPFSIVAETCVRGDSGRDIQWPAKTWSILNLLIFQVSSISYDLRIIAFIHKHVNSLSKESKASWETVSLNETKSDGECLSRHQFIAALFDTSSYMAVPARATLLSALVLVPYLSLVPAVSMTFSSSMTTTSLILIITEQTMNIIRFPITLIATFTHLTTLKKRAIRKSRVERQRMVQREALERRQKVNEG